MEQYGPQEQPEHRDLRQPDYTVLTDDELQIFGGLLTRVLHQPPDLPTTDVLGATYERVFIGEFRAYRRADQHMAIERIEVLGGSARPAGGDD